MNDHTHPTLLLIKIFYNCNRLFFFSGYSCCIMGFGHSKTMEENLKRNQDFITEMNKVTVSFSILHHQIFQSSIHLHQFNHNFLYIGGATNTSAESNEGTHDGHANSSCQRTFILVWVFLLFGNSWNGGRVSMIYKFNYIFLIYATC